MKKICLYIIETKDDKVRIQAKNRDEAFAKFFLDVESGKVPIDKLGALVMLKDRKDEIPFRTVPLLFQLKLMSEKDAVANLMATVGYNKKEATEKLYDMGFKDARIIPIMRRIQESQSSLSSSVNN